MVDRKVPFFKSVVSGRKIPHVIGGRPYVGMRVEIPNQLTGDCERGQIISGPNEQGIFHVRLDNGICVRKRFSNLVLLY